MSLALFFAQHVCGYTALVRCVLALRFGSAGMVWCQWHQLVCLYSHSRKLLKMNVLAFETCWAKHNACDIKLVYLFNYQDDARSNKHKIHIPYFLEIWEPQTPGTSRTVQPVPVAARSKAWVCVRSPLGLRIRISVGHGCLLWILCFVHVEVSA